MRRIPSRGSDGGDHKDGERGGLSGLSGKLLPPFGATSSEDERRGASGELRRQKRE